MRFDGREYVLTRLGHRRLGAGANAIGERVLGYALEAPIGADLTPLIASLLLEYEVDPGVLEQDVREFVRECIGEGSLAEPGRLRVYGLDLSITNQCNASCVYCPTPRRRDLRRFLEIEEAGHIIDQLREPGFLKEFGTLTTLEVGGLAEPLLHPDAIDILRLFRSRYPVPHRILYTNGAALTPSRSKALVRDDLITSLVISIDGLNDTEHRASKGIPYDLVTAHLKSFLRARDEAGSPCQVVVNVLTWARYRDAVRRLLHRDPIQSPDPDPGIEDHTAAIVRAWRKRLGPRDLIRDATSHFQLRGEYHPESAPPPVDEAMLRCPWFEYVAHSLSITSNGDVLICCNDFEREGILGNCLTDGLHDIVRGARRGFLEALARDDRSRLPARCRRRAYCQVLANGFDGDGHDLQR